RPHDVLMAQPADFAFRQAGGSAAEFQVGLEYAVQSGWLEISETNNIKAYECRFCRNKARRKFKLRHYLKYRALHSGSALTTIVQSISNTLTSPSGQKIDGRGSANNCCGAAI